jgi:hypothetical protein
MAGNRSAWTIIIQNIPFDNSALEQLCITVAKIS